MPQDVGQELAKMAQRAANVTPHEMERLLKNAGWTLRRTSGGHALYTKAGARRPIPVPLHPGAMKKGLVLDMIKTIRESL